MAIGTALKGFTIPSTIGSVSDAQTSLNKYYGANLTVDGIWGAKTAAAWDSAQLAKTAAPKLPANTAVVAPSSAVTDLQQNSPTLNTSYATPVAGDTPAVGQNGFEANPAIAGLQTSIMNTPITPYDMNTDPAYASYSAKYLDAGKHASSDVMGQAAAMSGGRASSYSQAVASQARASWDQRLMDVIPTLQAADQQRKIQAQESMYRQLEMLQGADETRYQRGRDATADAKALSDEKLAQELATLGRYSADYAKEINRRTNTPDTSDDYLIPYLQTAREEKLAAQRETARTDAANALAQENWLKTYGLDKMNTQSLVSERSASGSGSSSATSLEEMGTPEQISQYEILMKVYTGAGGGYGEKYATDPDGALQRIIGDEVALREKIGDDLYERLYDNITAIATKVPQPKVGADTSYKADSAFVAALVDAKNGVFTLAEVEGSKDEIIARYGGPGVGDAAYQEILNAAVARLTKSSGSTNSSGLKPPPGTTGG